MVFCQQQAAVHCAFVFVYTLIPYLRDEKCLPMNHSPKTQATGYVTGNVGFMFDRVS